jgi:hypothetical protein
MSSLTPTHFRCRRTTPSFHTAKSHPLSLAKQVLAGRIDDVIKTMERDVRLVWAAILAVAVTARTRFRRVAATAPTSSRLTPQFGLTKGVAQYVTPYFPCAHQNPRGKLLTVGVIRAAEG